MDSEDDLFQGQSEIFFTEHFGLTLSCIIAGPGKGEIFDNLYELLVIRFPLVDEIKELIQGGYERVEIFSLFEFLGVCYKDIEKRIAFSRNNLLTIFSLGEKKILPMLEVLNNYDVDQLNVDYSLFFMFYFERKIADLKNNFLQEYHFFGESLMKSYYNSPFSVKKHNSLFSHKELFHAMINSKFLSSIFFILKRYESYFFIDDDFDQHSVSILRCIIDHDVLRIKLMSSTELPTPEFLEHALLDFANGQVKLGVNYFSRALDTYVHKNNLPSRFWLINSKFLNLKNMQTMLSQARKPEFNYTDKALLFRLEWLEFISCNQTLSVTLMTMNFKQLARDILARDVNDMSPLYRQALEQERMIEQNPLLYCIQGLYGPQNFQLLEFGVLNKDLIEILLCQWRNAGGNIFSFINQLKCLESLFIGQAIVKRTLLLSKSSKSYPEHRELLKRLIFFQQAEYEASLISVFDWFEMQVTTLAYQDWLSILLEKLPRPIEWECDDPMIAENCNNFFERNSSVGLNKDSYDVPSFFRK